MILIQRKSNSRSTHWCYLTAFNFVIWGDTLLVISTLLTVLVNCNYKMCCFGQRNMNRNIILRHSVESVMFSLCVRKDNTTHDDFSITLRFMVREHGKLLLADQ